MMEATKLRSTERIEYVLPSRRAVKEALRPLAIIRNVFQDRPYTCVEVEVTLSGARFPALGFSKCSWPDEWSVERGIEIAKEKAVAKLAEMIRTEDEYLDELRTAILNHE